jgi:hypothetical protein
MRPDPREFLDGKDFVQIAVPILIEVVAVILIVACGLVWMIIASTPGVPL